MPIHRYILLFGLCSFGSVYGQVAFLPVTFAEAVALAAKEGKNVYVNGSTQWCEPCAKMDAEAFSDSAVGIAMNEMYISIKVDVKEGEGIDFAIKFRSSTVPQHLFFDGEGHLVNREWGHLSPQSFLDLAIIARDSTPIFDPLHYPLDFKLDYPEWYRDFRKGANDRIFPDETQIETFLASRDSITDEVSWAVISTFPTPEKYAEVIAENMEVLISRYGKVEVLEELSSYAYKNVKVAIKEGNESLLNAALRKTDRLMGNYADGYKFRYRLYYYQMSGDWLSYAEVGAELSRNNELADGYWLNDVAHKIYQNTAEYQPIKSALTWMYAVIEKEENYPYLLTTARLEYTLGNRDKAIALTKRGLDAALDFMDTTEGEAFRDMLTGK